MKSLSTRLAVYSFARQLPDYYEDLGSLLETAKNIRQLEIFQSDAARYEGTPRGLLSQIWAERYEELGADLAATWEGFLPDDDVAIIRVQQDLGSDAICRALKDLAKTAKIKRQLQSAAQTSVGVGMLAMTIAIMAVAFMPSWGVGVLLQAFEVPTSDWGPVGRRLATWANFVHVYGPYIGLVFAIAFGWVVWSLDGWVGPGRDWADRKILLYRVYHEMFGIRSALTMATLTRKNASAMLTLRSAIEVLASSTTSTWKSWQLQRVIDHIDATGAASADVFSTGIFTQHMYWRLMDVTRAKPLAEAFGVIAQSIQDLWLPKLVRQMVVWRWILLLLALAVVVVLVAAFQSTVGEMKTVMMNAMTSRQ